MSKYYPDCFTFCLTQDSFIWVEKLNSKTISISLSVGKSVVYFLDYWLIVDKFTLQWA